MKAMDILYTKKGSNDHTTWIKCGVLLVGKKDGSMRMRLDALPIPSSFDGWLLVKEHQSKREGEDTSIVDDVPF